MDTLDEFYAQWYGKYPNFDGYYGSQCWDLAQYYSQKVGGPRWWGNAADIYDQPGGAFIQIPNSPSAVPQRGDVVVWGGGLNGGPGHVGIATGEGDTNWFNSFDVNWPTGSPAHVQRHNYDYVRGWLRPLNYNHGASAPQQEDGMQNVSYDQKKQLYNTYLGRDPEDQGGITELDFYRAAAGEIQSIRNGQQQNIKDLRDQVTRLNKMVADAQALIATMQKKLDDADANTASLQKKVDELNKQISEGGVTYNGLDNFSLGDLLSAAFKKLFKIK